MEPVFAYNTLSITDTVRGGFRAIYEGQEYGKTYVAEDTIDCKCIHQRKNCRARLLISRSEPPTVIQVKGEHNHMPKCEGELIADVAYRTMLSMAIDTTLAPSSIYQEVLSGVPEQHRDFMKTRRQCINNIQYTKRMHKAPEPVETEMVIEGDLRHTVDGEDWVLYDNPVEKMVVFASNSMLSQMSGAEVLLMDGMYEVPSIGYQLYTIHALVGEATIPVAYALLPSKKTAIYDHMLTIILEAFDNRNIPRPNPDAVVIDFEIAASTGCFST